MEPVKWLTAMCWIGSHTMTSATDFRIHALSGVRSIRSTLQNLEGQQTVPFEPHGKVHPTQTTLEIEVDLDLTPFQVMCQKVQEELPEINQTHSMPGLTTTTPVWHALNECCNDVRSWPTNFGLFQTYSHRDKRNPLALGALLGVGISMAAAWTFKPAVNPQIQKNADYIRQHQTYLEELTKQHHMLSKWSYQAELRLTLQEARTTTRAITQGLSALINVGRVTPALLTGADARNIWPQVQHAVRQQQGEAELPVDSPVALYQFPAQFALRNGRLQLRIDMPLITETLSLYQRANFPLGRADADQPVTIVRPEAHAYLAVDRRHSSYVVLSAEQLNRCLHLGENHFCPGLTIHKDFADVCEAALFAGLHEPVTKLCQVEPFIEAWKVWPQQERRYHLYTATKMRGKLLCNETQTPTEFDAGFHRITLEPSCALSTGKFYLPKESRVTVKANTVTPLVPGIEGLVMVQRQQDYQQQLDAIRAELTTRELSPHATGADAGIPTWAIITIAMIGAFALSLLVTMAGVLTYFGAAIRRAFDYTAPDDVDPHDEGRLILAEDAV